MRITFAIIGAIIGLNLLGQVSSETREGFVSYVTSQSVYVRFASTGGIDPGDSLFLAQGDDLAPALVVRQVSSISCVCDPLGSNSFNTGDQVVALIDPESDESMVAEKGTEEIDQEPTADNQESPDTSQVSQEEIRERKQHISGRVAVSSYSDFSDTPAANSQRMRYTFSLDGRNLGGSRLSAETYISFHHRVGEKDELQESIFNGLKIYALDLIYDFDDKTRLLAGRKINRKISSLGAVDGLQAERDLGDFTIGAVIGSRPDYIDYGFNFDLFQFGGYISHEKDLFDGNIQSTLAFMEQKNSGNTDRRFAYLQHSNTLLRNLYFFGSAEIDLYTEDQGTPGSTFNLTGLYLMVRYRIIRELSITGSYNARQNVIYFESYKNIIDRLLERETLQGFRLQVHYRPLKHLSVGVTGNYRYRNDDVRPTRNVYGYVTYSRIPLVGLSATISATYLEAAYNTGRIYSAGLSRSFLRGILSAGLNYRYVDYSFFTADLPFTQNYAEANLQWSVYRKLSLSLYYEGAFEDTYTHHRVYVNITQRF